MLRPITLLLLASTAAFPAGGSVIIDYRDGVVEWAGRSTSSYVRPFVRHSREHPGDVDLRCDGMCRVVVCDCPLRISDLGTVVGGGRTLCGKYSPPECIPNVAAIRVGERLQLQQREITVITLNCHDSARCRRRRAGQP